VTRTPASATRPVAGSKKCSLVWIASSTSEPGVLAVFASTTAEPVPRCRGPHGASWSPDGREIVAVGGPLYVRPCLPWRSSTWPVAGLLSRPPFSLRAAGGRGRLRLCRGCWRSASPTGVQVVRAILRHPLRLALVAPRAVRYRALVRAPRVVVIVPRADRDAFCSAPLLPVLGMSVVVSVLTSSSSSHSSSPPLVREPLKYRGDSESPVEAHHCDEQQRSEASLAMPFRGRTGLPVRPSSAHHQPRQRSVI
jgi:hypothetical protein